MPTIPVYVAILTSRKLSDIVEVFADEAAALNRCRGWLRMTSGAKEELTPGLCFWAQYGTQEETVRVERHMLELPAVIMAVASYKRGCAETAEPVLHLDLEAIGQEARDE